LCITINSSNVYIRDSVSGGREENTMLLTLLSTAFAFAFFSSFALSAHLQTSKTVISPHTGKTYLFHESENSYDSAEDICASFPTGKLASLQPNSGDIEFLGGFIEVDSPYWIGKMTGTALDGACSAIYAAGAIAIPKRLNSHKSPCENHLKVLCELE
jgi:hypothetical protein